MSGRILGWENKRIVREPAGFESHSLLTAGTGRGKTTLGVLPWLFGLLGDHQRTILINDPKSGEIFAQCARMCEELGRKVYLIDDARVHGNDRRRIDLNPLSNVSESFARRPRSLVSLLHTTALTLIPEPRGDGDDKNKYFRDGPRKLLRWCVLALNERSPECATPAGVLALLSDVNLMLEGLVDTAESGNSTLARLSLQLTTILEKNPEHWSQFIDGAIDAVEHFDESGLLHPASGGPQNVHEEIMSEHPVIFLCGPQEHMASLGSYYGLHINSFISAQLSGRVGRTDFILDEFANTPLRQIIPSLPVIRAYGGNCHMIIQSRKHTAKVYGEAEMGLIEEMTQVRQYFGVADYDEAERLSRAMGDKTVVQESTGFTTKSSAVNRNFSLGRERTMTATELLNMPRDRQLIYIADSGFFESGVIRQNEVAPHCHMLDDNPLEGKQFPAQPKVTLKD